MSGPAQILHLFFPISTQWGKGRIIFRVQSYSYIPENMYFLAGLCSRPSAATKTRIYTRLDALKKMLKRGIDIFWAVDERFLVDFFLQKVEIH